jgi:hypothetical protein
LTAADTHPAVAPVTGFQGNIKAERVDVRIAAGHALSPPRAFQSNIPARRLPFVGREKLLDRIHDLLGDASQDSVIVLHGPAGVGKSELAREFARCHHDKYPGGTFFINARTDAVPVDLAQIGRTWLGLDLPHDLRLEDQGLRTLRTLGEAPSLLIFDNVLGEDAIRPWLPPSGMPCHAVITSVVDCWDVGWTVIPVEPLSDAASLELIEGIAGREVAARYGQRLARLAGGLPVQIVPASGTMHREWRRGRIDTISLTLTQEAGQSFRGVYTQLEAPARLLIHAAARLNCHRIIREELKGQFSEAKGWTAAEFDRHLDTCLDVGVLDGEADLHMHQLFASFILGTALSEDIAGKHDQIVSVQARRMVETAKKVVAAPNRADLAAILMTYPVDLQNWKNADTVFSIHDVESTGRALLEIGQFAAAKPWFERAVAEAEKAFTAASITRASAQACTRWATA